MIEVPDRIGNLIKRLEAGESVTRQDVARLAALQSLDLAKIGEDFARQAMLADESQSKELTA